MIWFARSLFCSAASSLFPEKSQNRSSDLPLSFAPRLFCLRPVSRSAHVRRKNSEKRFRWVYIPAVKPPTCRLSDSRVYYCVNAADYTASLKTTLYRSAYAVRRRTSRSDFGSAVHGRSPHGHADPLRAVTVCPVLPDERYSRSDFGLTQLFANKSAPRQTVTGKAEPHDLTAAMKNARKRSFSPKPAVTITVMQVFDCGAIPVRQPPAHNAQP